MNNFTEPEEVLQRLATLDIEKFLTKEVSSSYKTCNKETIVTVIEKLAMLKNIKIDYLQVTAIVTELLNLEMNNQELYEAYTYILSLQLWNNELNVEHFLKASNNEMQIQVRKKAKEIVNKLLEDTIKTLNSYEKVLFPFDIWESYTNKFKELTNLKSKLLKDFESTLNDAIVIDATLLSKYLSDSEIKLITTQIKND